MKNLWLAGCILLGLLTSCTGSKKQSDSATDATGSKKQSGPVAVIDVAGGIQHPTALKMSDFGKKVRYIPLETNDSCLIGNAPVVQVLKKHILITTSKDCFLFDKADGKFLCSIGHIGEDPEGYSGTQNWVDEAKEMIYFKRQPNQLQKYNFKGNYIGKISFPTPPGTPAYFLFTDTSIIGHYPNLWQASSLSLAEFTPEGILQDSIPTLLTPIQETAADIESISVLKSAREFGTWSESGLVFINYKNDKRFISAAAASTLWESGGEVRFKENFVDTIYTVTGKELAPYMVFDTGKYFWPANERTSTKDAEERVLVNYASETDRFVYFQYSRGLYTRESGLYLGLYDKATGETRMSPAGNDITDDLTNFMPFFPIKPSSSGEFVGMIGADKVLEWLEEHPQTKKSGPLEFLNTLTEEMNQVIVLVE